MCACACGVSIRVCFYACVCVCVYVCICVCVYMCARSYACVLRVRLRSHRYAMCVFPNSKDQFSVNTLAHPQKNGAIFRIKFLGLKKSGVPEHPAYLDNSPDRQDWKWLCQQFPPPKDVSLGKLQRKASGVGTVH